MQGEQQANEVASDPVLEAVGGLRARSALVRTAEAALDELQTGERLAILLLDVDDFRLLNDTFGHGAGDDVLREVARRLDSVVRDGDIVARVGPDEFAVLCERVREMDELTRLAQRFLGAMTTDFKVHDQRIRLGAHVGIAATGPSQSSVVDLIRDAATALQRAREAGFPVAVFDPRMRERSREFLEMASDLRGAVARRQLRVEYQPIVTLPGGELSALEALARWSHPRRGHVSPVDFIPVAEKSGLISEIGDWVFHEAVDSAVRWCEMVGESCPRVSVNVSAHQLRDPDFVYAITRGLEHYDLPFDRLQLEVTESAVIENIEAAVESLRLLSGLGVKIALDDFGAGNSSLWLLKELNWIDVLKVDKSFVTGLCDSDQNLAIVKAVIDLAGALGMSVVAEGVEIKSEAEALARLDCEQAQGWLFGRPLRPTAADAAVVAAHHSVEHS